MSCDGNAMQQTDIGHLGPDKKKVIETMLKEKINSFFKDDQGIGCARELQLEIELIDDQPVQTNYTALPRPLYSEVKGYIEDLLSRRFIRPQKSQYSSPCVCVQKRGGIPRFCIDYRLLNQNTIRDKHPFPKAQETLDSLGGSCRFTTLDQ